MYDYVCRSSGTKADLSNWINVQVLPDLLCATTCCIRPLVTVSVQFQSKSLKYDHVSLFNCHKDGFSHNLKQNLVAKLVAQFFTSANFTLFGRCSHCRKMIFFSLWRYFTSGSETELPQILLGSFSRFSQKWTLRFYIALSIWKLRDIIVRAVVAFQTVQSAEKDCANVKSGLVMKYTSECVLSSTDELYIMRSISSQQKNTKLCVIGLSKMCHVRLLAVWVEETDVTEDPAYDCSSVAVVALSRMSCKVVCCPEE